MWAYYWSTSVSVGHPAGALTIICLWVLLTWSTYAYGMLCQDDVAPGEFLLFQCACYCFELGTSTHVCSWSITDHYIIKRHVSHAWYRCWSINALVEAEVLWWLYSDLRGHSSAIVHCQTFNVFIFKNNKTSKNLLLRQKCYTDTGYACTSSVASKRAVIEWLAKNFVGEKIAHLLVMYSSAL